MNIDLTVTVVFDLAQVLASLAVLLPVIWGRKK